MGPLYTAVAWIIDTIHSGLSHITDASWTWGLSIILLTVLMRIVLFPLFMKQIRSQREMQLLQPKIAALKEQYPDDKAKQNEMQMQIFKEHGVNPFAGCLPLLIQLPVFLALFGVLHKFTVGKNGEYHGYAGLSASTVKEIAQSKFLGVPLAAAFKSSKKTLLELHANPHTVHTVTLIVILLMMATGLLSSWQMMSNNKARGTQSSGGQDGAQKALLYGIPLIFGWLGLGFPMGVLIYWVTTNFWTLGQQSVMLKRMGNDPEALIAGGPGIRPDPPTPPAGELLPE